MTDTLVGRLLQKTCKNCGVEKPLTAFAKEKLGVLGCRKVCKDCRNVELRSGYRATAEYRSKRMAQSRLENPDKFRERERQWAANNPDKIARKNAARPPESREHQRARNMVRNAVERGELTRPTHCHHCGEPRRLYGHHPDYSKPLSVDWLCASCHRIEHLRMEGKR